MYLYLYDAALRQRQYERVLGNLEIKLTDLGVAGKIVRLSSLLSPREIVLEEKRRAAQTKTVVIVGDDAAFTKIVQQVADIDMVFGWVPIGSKTDLAARFGLPYGMACASILSRRRVIGLDIAQFNQFFFLDYCKVPLSTITMALDGRVSVSAAAQRMECAIWNLPPVDRKGVPPGYTPSPVDRQLEIVLTPLERRHLFNNHLASTSIFPFREVRLKVEKTVPVVIDGHVYKENQINVRLAPNRLKLIIGKCQWANF